MALGRSRTKTPGRIHAATCALGWQAGPQAEGGARAADTGQRDPAHTRMKNGRIAATFGRCLVALRRPNTP